MPKKQADRRSAAPPSRRRRDAVTARAAILDAAERRLVASGPAGIRLQEVAADAGVSHPTVLHHFGSRALLVKAVITRALAKLHVDLVDALQSSTGDEAHLSQLVESVFHALSAGGHARLMMWLALEGQRIDRAEAGLFEVVDATHALRKIKHPGKRATRDDTANAVVLATLALLGASVIGKPIFENAGLEESDAPKKFRAWLTRLLLHHLEG